MKINKFKPTKIILVSTINKYTLVPNDFYIYLGNNYNSQIIGIGCNQESNKNTNF